MASTKLPQTTNLEGVSTQIVLSLTLMIARPLVEAAQSQWLLGNIPNTKTSNLAVRKNIAIQQPTLPPARCSPTQLSNHRWHPNVLSLLAILILLVLVGASIVAFKVCFKPVTAALSEGSGDADAYQQTASLLDESDPGLSDDGSEYGDSDSDRSFSDFDDVDAEDRPPSNPGSPSPEPSGNSDSESIPVPSNQNLNVRPDGGSPPPPPPGSFTAFFEDNFWPVSDWILRILHMILVLSGIIAIWRSMPYSKKNCVSFPAEDHAATWSVRDTLEDSKPSASSEIPRSARPTTPTQSMCLPKPTNTFPLPRPSARVQRAVPPPVVPSPSTPADLATPLNLETPINVVVQRRAKTTFTIYDASSIVLVGLLTFGSLVVPLFILKPKVVHLVWRYYTTESARVPTAMEQIGKEGLQGYVNRQPKNAITRTFTSVETQTDPAIESMDNEEADEEFIYPTSEEAQDVIGTVNPIGVEEYTEDDEEDAQFVYPTSQMQDVPNTCQSEPIPSLELDFGRLSHTRSETPRRHSLSGEGNYDSQPDAPADLLEEIEPIPRSPSTSTWVPDPDAAPFVPIQRMHTVEEASPALEEASTSVQGTSASMWAAKTPEPEQEEPQTVVDGTMRLFEKASSSSDINQSQWARKSEEVPRQRAEVRQNAAEGVGASMWAKPQAPIPLQAIPTYESERPERPTRNKKKRKGQLGSRAR